MRVAFFDAIGGAAGDMILGAMLDAGLPLEQLRNELQKLAVSGYTLRVERVVKQHIAASQFLVDVARSDGHRHDGDAAGHGTRFTDILDLIRRSGVSEQSKSRALAVFQRLGEAEARIHGVALDQVHFHEVGAVDSIVDVVGASIGLELLGIERVFCSTLPIGSGQIETRHGTYPLPAPATLEILASARVPTRPSSEGREQVTPTGAAILTEVATFEQPPMRVEKIGYGSGESDLQVPNVLRMWIGQTDGPEVEELRVLEVNIDDMIPELYGSVIEHLFEAGALDVWLTPVLMKKGRPGQVLQVLCKPLDQQRMTDLLLRETSTLGVRARTVERFAAEREVVAVDTVYGRVSVKVKLLDGRPVAATPEYEDCRRVADERHVPVIDIYSAAAAAGRELLVEP